MTVNIGDAFKITRDGPVSVSAATPVGNELLLEGDPETGARPASSVGLLIATPAELQKLIKQLAEPEHISQLHVQCDVDHSSQSYHHTLGGGIGQAAPGNHSHGNSAAAAFAGTGAIIPAASPGTPVATITKVVTKGRRYTLLLTAFDLVTTVAGDRFSYLGVADGNSLTLQTIPLPNAGINLSPAYIGTWVADHTGSVVFTVNIIRAAGTGTINVNGGMFIVMETVDAV